MLGFLPDFIYKEVKKYNNVCEIRLRVNLPIQITTLNESIFISKYKIDCEILQKIVLNVCNNSIYGYDEYIKKGFITSSSGVRIGLSGEFVYDNGKINCIKNFSSLCIRIPNDVIGFSKKFYQIYSGGSVLVISKSGVGKTTFIRDFLRNVSLNTKKNIVVVDERNEIAFKNLKNSYYLGDTVDVLTFSNKNYGFTHAIRTLNPSVIVTDELIESADFESVIKCVDSGVDVIATIHGGQIDLNKLKKFINLKTFNYYVLITANNNLRIVTVYNQNLQQICSY